MSVKLATATETISDFQRRTPICTKIGPGTQYDLYSPKIESILTLRDSFKVKFKVK